jgi:phytoene dehydrogenase-like protein
MSTASVHDVIVIGSDLAGLLAAGLLRRSSYRVLWVGQGGLRDQYEHESIPVPAIPRLLPKRGLAPALDQVLDDLAIEDPVHQLGLQRDNHLQIVFPDQRIDLFADPKALDAELLRALPDQRQEFLRSLDTLAAEEQTLVELLRSNPPLPPVGFAQRIRAGRLERQRAAGRIGLDLQQLPPLLAVLVQATAFLSHLDLQDRASSATAHLVRVLLAGMRCVPDLSERVVAAIQKAGVEVEGQMVAEQLLLEGRRVVGFQALRSANTYRSEAALLAAMPLSEAVELVPTALRRCRARLAADALRARTSVFNMNLVLPTEALPRGMATQVLMVRRPQDPLVEDNLIRIVRVPMPQRKDREWISVACVIPNRSRSLGREYLGPLEQRLLQATGWLIPFVEQNQEGRSSPFWNARATDPGHPAPWLLHRTIEPVGPTTLGLALHTPKTALKNLMLCGPEILPGLGIEGEALAARSTVEWLLRHRKRKQIL